MRRPETTAKTSQADVPQKLSPVLRDVFLETYRHDLKALRQALEHDDAGRFLGALHKIKGALAILGEKPLACACTALASRARHGSLVRVEAALVRFDARVHALAERFAQQRTSG